MSMQRFHEPSVADRCLLDKALAGSVEIRRPVRSSKVGHGLLALTVLFFSGGVLSSQSTGRLTGTVVDRTAGVVPEARVRCNNTGTGLSYAAATDEEGVFRFPQLPIGGYELIVSHPNFQRLVHRDIQLLTGHVLDLKMVIDVGEVTETVEVSRGGSSASCLRVYRPD